MYTAGSKREWSAPVPTLETLLGRFGQGKRTLEYLDPASIAALSQTSKRLRRSVEDRFKSRAPSSSAARPLASAVEPRNDVWHFNPARVQIDSEFLGVKMSSVVLPLLDGLFWKENGPNRITLSEAIEDSTLHKLSFSRPDNPPVLNRPWHYLYTSGLPFLKMVENTLTSAERVNSKVFPAAITDTRNPQAAKMRTPAGSRLTVKVDPKEDDDIDGSSADRFTDYQLNLAASHVFPDVRVAHVDGLSGTRLWRNIRSPSSFIRGRSSEYSIQTMLHPTAIAWKAPDPDLHEASGNMHTLAQLIEAVGQESSLVESLAELVVVLPACAGGHARALERGADPYFTSRVTRFAALGKSSGSTLLSFWPVEPEGHPPCNGVFPRDGFLLHNCIDFTFLNVAFSCPRSLQRTFEFCDQFPRTVSFACSSFLRINGPLREPFCDEDILGICQNIYSPQNALALRNLRFKYPNTALEAIDFASVIKFAPDIPSATSTIYSKLRNPFFDHLAQVGSEYADKKLLQHVEALIVELAAQIPRMEEKIIVLFSDILQSGRATEQARDENVAAAFEVVEKTLNKTLARYSGRPGQAHIQSIGVGLLSEDAASWIKTKLNRALNSLYKHARNGNGLEFVSALFHGIDDKMFEQDMSKYLDLQHDAFRFKEHMITVRKTLQDVLKSLPLDAVIEAPFQALKFVRVMFPKYNDQLKYLEMMRVPRERLQTEAPETEDLNNRVDDLIQSLKEMLLPPSMKGAEDRETFEHLERENRRLHTLWVCMCPDQVLDDPFVTQAREKLSCVAENIVLSRAADDDCPFAKNYNIRATTNSAAPLRMGAS